MGHVIVDGVEYGDSGSSGDAGPMTKTERDGAFAGEGASVSLDAGAADVNVSVSSDERWHLSVEHDARTTVMVEGGPAALSVDVKAPAVVGSNVFGDSVVVRGSVIRGSVVNGASVGGRKGSVTLSLPAGCLYDLDARTGMGDIDILGKKLRFGAVSARTGSGNVVTSLSNSRARRVSAKTGMGNVTAALPLAGGCEATAETGMGDATIDLGRVGNARVDLSTGMGDREVNHPDLVKVGKGRWATSSSSGDAYDVSAKTGMGDADVRLSTVEADSEPAPAAAPEPVVSAEQASKPEADKAAELAAVMANVDLSKLPEGALDSPAAGGVTVALPGGWISSAALSDPAMAAMVGEGPRKAVEELAQIFRRDIDADLVWAVDFLPFLSVIKSVPAGAAMPEMDIRFIVVIDDQDTKSPAEIRKLAAGMSGVYAPLAVEGADWAAEMRASGESDGKQIGMAVFWVGYEHGAAMIIFAAPLPLFDADVFRGIAKTIKPIA